MIKLNKNTSSIHHTTHTTGKPGGGVINKQTREAMLKKLGLKKVKK